jgi:hypothetical protein
MISTTFILLAYILSTLFYNRECDANNEKQQSLSQTHNK